VTVSRPDGSALRALFWLAVFVAGQVAAMRLTIVTPYAVYPHLVDWAEAVRTSRLELSILVLQTVAVLVALRPVYLLRAARVVVGSMGAGRVITLAAVIGFGLAVPTDTPSRFLREVVLAAWIMAAAMLTLLRLVHHIPAGFLDRAARRLPSLVTLGESGDRAGAWDRWIPWMAATWVVIVSAGLSRFVLEGVPHIDDGVAYLFQAKTFAMGRLFVPPPPDPDSFATTHFIITSGAWYSKYFLGWPAILALGVVAGAPWLVNPILCGAAVLLAHSLARRLYDRGTATGMVLLLATSPWLLYTSSSLLSHSAALACALLALLAVDRQRGARVGAWSVVAGAALGLLFLVRPLDAALLGVVVALWALGLWGRRLTSGSLVTIALVAASVAALSLPYNATLTGDILRPPHSQWSETLWGPGVDALGFGPDVGIPLWREHDPLPGHGLPDVILNTNKNVYLLSTELFGWATGSLWLLLLPVVLGRRRAGDGVMLAVVTAVVLANTLYWHPGGPDLGPRYWYLAIVPLAVLSVRGAAELGRLLQVRTQATWSGRHVVAGVLVASLAGLLLGVPWRAATKYHRYRDIGAEVASMARRYDWEHALIFLRQSERSDYQAAFNSNTPELGRGGPVYARDAGPEHRALVVKAFPDRPIWLIGRRPDGSDGLVVLEGPLEAGRNPPWPPYQYERPYTAILR
jgi:hypothetical protein